MIKEERREQERNTVMDEKQDLPFMRQKNIGHSLHRLGLDESMPLSSQPQFESLALPTPVVAVYP